MADGTHGLVPPSDLDAEGVVLSAVMLDASQLDEARQWLSSADFYADANRRIWDAIVELDAVGQAPVLPAVAGLLRDRGNLQSVGGTPYLAQLCEGTPATAHVEQFAKRIADKARQRSVIAACQRFAAEGYSDVGDVSKWAQDAAQALADVAASGRVQDPAETMAELVPAKIAELQQRAADGCVVTGIETGWRDLTRKIGGWTRGKLHVVGGRPGMGKSAFVLGACLNVARQGLGVVFISAEMTKGELTERALAVASRVHLSAVATGQMDRLKWGACVGASQELRRWPLSIRYCPGATVGEIRGTVRSELRRMGKPPGLVVVDYIQILNGEREKGENREQEVSRISRRLTWMAAEFDVPVLAVSQLNRSVESRANKNKRPTMADLRESGGIEQDAFTITLLYRDEYYDKGTQLPGVVETIVAKNRNGASGTVRLKFHGPTTRIDDLAEGEFADIGEDGL